MGGTRPLRLHFTVFPLPKIRCGETTFMKSILIIEDDRDIIELVRYNLEKEGYRVSAAEDGVSGLAQAKNSPPDLLVLDLMLPKLPGLEICRDLRLNSKTSRLPILMLTARGDEADRIVGLEMDRKRTRLNSSHRT